MSSPSLARKERLELCDLLDELGPEAPTLCEGWQTRDLAAHLVVRESRPDASAGIVIKPLESWTERVQATAAKRPYDELVERVRNGPPTLSFFAIPGVDAVANTLEYFVHHEDVRRAQAGWTPRALSGETRSELWRRLRANTKMLFRTFDVVVVLDPTDVADPGPLPDHPGAVILRGPVAELIMHAFGREQARDIEFIGDPEMIERYRAGSRGV